MGIVVDAGRIESTRYGQYKLEGTYDLYGSEEPNLSGQPKRGANVCNRANIFESKVSDDMINEFEG